MATTTYRLRLDTSSFDRSLMRSEQKVMGLERRLNRLRLGGGAARGGAASKIGGSSILGFSPALLGVTAIATGIGAITSKLVRMAAEADSARFSLRKIFGKEGGDNLLNDIEQFAAFTPFNFREVLQQSIKLAGIGVSKENILPFQNLLGNFAATLKADPQLLTKALSDVLSKGRLEGQEVKQFANQNLAVKRIVADFRGVSTAAVEGTLITSKEFLRALQHAQREGTKFHDVMIEKSKTLEGRWQNVGDAVDLVFKRGGEEALPGLSMIVSGLESSVRILGGVKLGQLADNLFLVGNQIIKLLNIGGEGQGKTPLVTLIDTITLSINALAAGFAIAKFGVSGLVGVAKASVPEMKAALSTLNSDLVEIALKQAAVLRDFGTPQAIAGLTQPKVAGINFDDKVFDVGGVGAVGSSGGGAGSAGLSGTSGRVKSVTINVENVIREQNINGKTTLGETTEEIKTEVERALQVVFAELKLAI